MAEYIHTLIDYFNRRHGEDVSFLEYVSSLIGDQSLPMPTKVIGSGCFGTAFETTDPKWVLKITSTPHEWKSIQTLLMVAPQLVCKVLAHQDLDGYSCLIWKETCRTSDFSCNGFREDYDVLEAQLLAAIGCPDLQIINMGYNSEGSLVIFDP